MRLRKEQLIIHLFLLAVMLVFLLSSIGYGFKMKVTPLLVSALGVTMIVISLLGEIFPKLGSRFGAGIEAAFTKGGASKKFGTEETDLLSTGGKELVILIIWISGYLLSVLFFGFYLSSLVFLFVFLKLARRIPWLKSVVFTVVTVGVIYGLFDILLRYRLFGGILFGNQLI